MKPILAGSASPSIDRRIDFGGRGDLELCKNFIQLGMGEFLVLNDVLVFVPRQLSPQQTGLLSLTN